MPALVDSAYRRAWHDFKIGEAEVEGTIEALPCHSFRSTKNNGAIESWEVSGTNYTKDLAQ